MNIEVCVRSYQPGGQHADIGDALRAKFLLPPAYVLANTHIAVMALRRIAPERTSVSIRRLRRRESCSLIQSASWPDITRRSRLLVTRDSQSISIESQGYFEHAS